MGLTLLQIDAFTPKPFAGNPAAVCVLDRARDAAWMQTVAQEMNLAETAFLVRRNGGSASDGYDLRWFTPTVEIDLCGHATLAAAHGLWELGHLPATETARFHSRSGLLTCRQEQGWIWMDFPATPAAPAEPPPGLLESLGLASGTAPVFVGRNAFDYFVVLKSEAEVRALTPNLTQLRTHPVRGTIVTARSTSGEYDCVSRFFAPAAGIDEDPVTGSAHCTLGPYWSAQIGRNILTGYQASPRGGVVRMDVQGKRVLLGGQAVTVLRGELV
jgi:PhzF family phenazine biosynthesis protein